jgi:hypothetical protein
VEKTDYLPCTTIPLLISAKKIVMSEFPKVESKIRVVICTSAFGLGVNVPNIQVVINWGAPRSIEEFLQEFERSGRDGRNAMSVLYYHGIDISKTATDDMMRSYATTETCRRALLEEYFTPDTKSSPVSPKHLCCNNCIKTCECLNCPTLHDSLLNDLEEDIALCSAVAKCGLVVFHTETELQRTRIRAKLMEYRETFVEASVPSLLNVDLLTGLSLSMIESIVNNVQYISGVDDLLSDYIFDRCLAKSVMCIIDEILA